MGVGLFLECVGFCPRFLTLSTLTFFLMFIYDSEIVSSIYQGLENLNDTNAMLHDYWVSELYTEEGDIISEMWNGDVLKQIETDVMHQICL